MAADNRTMQTVIRQWQQLEQIKSRLVRAGLLSADATPQQVEQVLRQVVPADLFAKQ